MKLSFVEPFISKTVLISDGSQPIIYRLWFRKYVIITFRYPDFYGEWRLKRSDDKINFSRSVSSTIRVKMGDAWLVSSVPLVIVQSSDPRIKAYAIDT